MPKRDQITAQELAAYWGVTPIVVYRAAKQGKIPGLISKDPRARYFFDKEEALAGWVPAEVHSWAKDLKLPGKYLTGGSELTERGGRVGIRNQVIARLHDLHVLVTTEDWAAIINKAVEQAIAGDRHARKWLGDYLMGSPIQRIEAELGVTTKAKFSDELRAQAIQALLQQAQERVTVDVTPKETGGSEPNTNREVPS